MKTSILIRRAQGFLSTRPWAAVLVVLLFADPLQGEPRSGHTDWGSWSFAWEVRDGAGLGIRNVYYKGRKVIAKANMPVIRVKYDTSEPTCVDPSGDCVNHCDGTPTPYVDRISWDDLRPSVNFCGKTFSCRNTFPICGSEKVYQQSYWIYNSRGSRHWLQIGAFADLKIGGQKGITNPDSSRMHMGWRLSEDGFIEPFLQSAVVIQCDHVSTHHAYWRIDFDVNGAASDQAWVYVHHGLEPGWHKYTKELDAVKDPDSKTFLHWSVRNDPTGHRVDIFPGGNDGVKDGFSPLDIGVRLYKSPQEGVPWPGADSDVSDLKYDEDENIAEKDIVFWYVSHLRHTGGVGCKWRMTGPTFKVQWPVEIR